MKTVAIIPARAGSKSIKNKNVQLLNGKPLISYSIETGIAANEIDTVIVSTDSYEIKEISENFGASVPFIRPKSLSRDTSVDYEYLSHALKFMEKKGPIAPFIFVVLRPTHPIRKIETVNDAIKMYKKNMRYDSLRSVRISDQSPYKMWTISEGVDMKLEPVMEDKSDNNVELYNHPRQLLSKVYWQDGYIDIVKTDTIKNKVSSTGDFILPYIIHEQTIDIDYLDEFEQAERYLINKNKKNKTSPRHPS